MTTQFLTEVQTSVRDTARRFAEGEVLPRAAAIDREDVFDRTLYRGMAELGLFGVSLPESSGGSGLDTVSLCLVMEELSRCSAAIGNAFAIPVEAALFLHHHGNASQKALIPGILDGSIVFATAMT
ncbi:MAG: acyl-CoA dehydrogenase family protein, partial [Variovorax sp.]